MDLSKINKTFDVAINGSSDFQRVYILDVDEDYCYGITPRKFSIHEQEVIIDAKVIVDHPHIIKIVEANSIFKLVELK